MLADIHGRDDRFHEILKTIAFSQNDVLYILGDVVDRNPGGIQILEEIMSSPNIHMLMGNHEYMMLNAIKDPQFQINSWCTNLDLWYLNGGEVTREAFYRFGKQEQKEILDYIKELPLNIPIRIGEKNFLLVHGSPVSMFGEANAQYTDEMEFAVWNRFDPLTDEFDPNTTLICGHTPTIHLSSITPMEVFKWHNVFCIDCGCAYSSKEGGRLACMCLETSEIWYSTSSFD